MKALMQTREHFGIVGGGLLGLTLALRLVQRGYRVTLLEAADHVGNFNGRISAECWRRGGLHAHRRRGACGDG